MILVIITLSDRFIYRTRTYVYDIPVFKGSLDVSVGTVTGCGVDGQGKRDFHLLDSVQTGTGAHPASYPMGNLGPLPEGKAAGT
jgi:hypothetical protein